MILLFPAGGTIGDAHALRLLETEPDAMGVQRAGLRTVPEMLAFLATTGKAAGVDGVPDLGAVAGVMQAEQLSRRYHNVLHACDITKWILSGLLGAGTPDELDALQDVSDGVDPLLGAYRGLRSTHGQLRESGIRMQGLREACAPCIRALLWTCEALAAAGDDQDEQGLLQRIHAVRAMRFNLSWFKEPGCDDYDATPAHKKVKIDMYDGETPATGTAGGATVVLPLGAWHAEGGPVCEADCLGSPMALVELALDTVELHLREELAKFDAAD